MKDIKTAEEIKESYAIELGYNDWTECVNDQPNYKIEALMDEVLLRYANQLKPQPTAPTGYLVNGRYFSALDIQGQTLSDVDEVVELYAQPTEVSIEWLSEDEIQKFAFSFIAYDRQVSVFGKQKAETILQATILAMHHAQGQLQKRIKPFEPTEVERLKTNKTDLLVLFLDDLREYIHESGNNLYTDERDSKEFVDIFLTKHK